jgi:hypothetical protein
MITLEEKIRAIYNSSKTARLDKVLRIKSGVNYYNYVWTIDGAQSGNWFGFKTLDECVDDCITYLAIEHYEKR